ncbi:chromosome partition protein MukE [Candidatus Williamhamiltonella defendens]|uniref:chromosome partition protein MukE n=1 Tax=Candidatus Williamhamiltonella defendens TaxID=138072 RepID=UPI00387E780A
MRAPEGFLFTASFQYPDPRSVLPASDMILGKILCYLYLSPERLNNHGIFSDARAL